MAGVGIIVSPTATITIDPGAYAAFVRSPQGPIARDLMRRGTNVQTAARFFVRKRTRKLERSIVKRAGVDAQGPYVLVVTEGVPYAQFEHDGTVPHIIRPRRRKSLRFLAGGGVVFARVVKHPGSKGSHFMTRAVPYAAN